MTSTDDILGTRNVVTHIAEDDMQVSGGHPSPSKHTRYDYVGPPAWHYADDDGLTLANRKTWDQWRGYAEVHTTVGDEPGTRTLTVTKFMRGMHGDRAAPTGNTQRPPVTVPASIGTEMVYDHDQFAGDIREQVTYDGVTSKPVSKTVYVPWRSNPTASRTITDSTGYSDTVEARYVRTAMTYEATALGVDGSRGWRTTRVRSDIDHTYGTVNWTQDDGDISKTGDEQCITYTYNRNTDKNLTGPVSRTLTTALACGTAPATVDDVISDSRTYFDGATSLTAPPNSDPRPRSNSSKTGHRPPARSGRRPPRPPTTPPAGRRASPTSETTSQRAPTPPPSEARSPRPSPRTPSTGPPLSRPTPTGALSPNRPTPTAGSPLTSITTSSAASRGYGTWAGPGPPTGTNRQHSTSTRSRRTVTPTRTSSHRP